MVKDGGAADPAAAAQQRQRPALANPAISDTLGAGRIHSARTPEGRSLTFDTRADAEAWLTPRHSEILRGGWLPPTKPKAASITFRAYAAAWLAGRDLEQTTRGTAGRMDDV